MNKLLFLLILLIGLPVNAKTRIVVHEDISGYGELSTKSCSLMKVLEFEDEDVDEAFKEISKNDPTAYIDKKDYKQQICDYSEGDALNMFNAFHYNNFGNNKVKVAVIDSGLIPKHKLFKNRKITRNSKKDIMGHGTGVAGVIADCTPKNVTIMSVRLFDDSGCAYHSDVVFAVDYAIKHGADVINFSAGCTVPSVDEEAIFKKAYDKNILVFASAGNNNKERVLYPASSKYTIAVGAIDTTTKKIKKSSYSNYGSEVDFVAPGDGVSTADQFGRNTTMSGTSISAPHLSSAGCYLKLVDKNMSVKTAYKYLRLSCIDYGAKGKDKYYGWGMPRVNLAVNRAYRGLLKNLKFRHGKLKTPKNFYVRYGDKYARIYRKKDKKFFVKRKII